MLSLALEAPSSLILQSPTGLEGTLCYVMSAFEMDELKALDTGVHQEFHQEGRRPANPDSGGKS